MRHKSSGFTLIELMVVLVIIGISFSLIMVCVGDFGAKRKLKIVAEELKHTIVVLEKQAIVESINIGIRVDKNGYQALRYEPPSNWIVMGNQALYKRHLFPKGTVINLQKNKRNNVQLPFILIRSTGELSPFILSLGSKNESTLYRLIGNDDGSVTITSE